jgi:hypothetical protein
VVIEALAPALRPGDANRQTAAGVGVELVETGATLEREEVPSW